MGSVAGTAKYLIQLSNEVDQWQVKMHALVNGAQGLSESEWLRFLHGVKSWPSTLDTTLGYVGKTQTLDRVGQPFTESLLFLLSPGG